MVKKMKYILLALLFGLLLASTTYAVTATISPVREILNVNIKSSEFTTLEKYVEVSNKNNFTVVVSFSPYGLDIELEKDKVTLAPNQTERVKYWVLISKEGNYSGGVTAYFSAPGKIPVSLSSELIIHAVENGSAVNDEAPTRPILLNPGEGETINDSVTLRWSSSSDPDNNTVVYYYFVDDNQDFSSPEISGWTLKNETTILPPKSGTLYWKVVASDGVHNVSSNSSWFVSETETTTTLPGSQVNLTVNDTETTTTVPSSTGSSSGSSGFAGGGTSSDNEQEQTNQSDEVNYTSLRGYIRPPKMILRGDPGTFTGSIEVKNINDFPITVKTKSMGDLEGNIVFDKSKIDLGVNESTQIKFTTIVGIPGRYVTDLVFIFSPKGKEEPNIALATQLILIVNQTQGEGSNETTTTVNASKSPTGFLTLKTGIALVGLVVVVIVVLVWYVRFREPSWKRRLRK